MGHRAVELSYKCDYLTYHCLAGKNGVKAVLENSKNVTPIGVSILTSFSDKDLVDIGFMKTAIQQSLDLVEMAYSVGARYFVCSPLEVKIIKDSLPEAILYVPVVQLAHTVSDQKRVGSPELVFAEGGDFIIMGRSILTAKNPLDTIKKINNHLDT
jgi:orotidine-5'-phosphate decarboxylase